MWILALFLFPLTASQPQAAAREEAYDPRRFERSVLATGFDRPMELDVASDGRIFIAEQGGQVLCYEPRSGRLEIAAQLEVFADQENGLLGLALDPRFEENGWIYLLWSPREHMGQMLSRLRVEGTLIDRSSERVLLSWIEQRRECCHHAGCLEFGPQGDLFISSGDNTNPFGSSGFAPIDERPGRFPWDAQRSSANSMSFSGKVLRIRPTAAGGYLVPPGNLFADARQGRPEIYIMGCRNPWRISIDSATGYLYWGDVGPDSSDDGERGPRGYDELNQAKGPGFFGWPLFIGDNYAYADFDFRLERLGERFDPAAPVNDSPNNRGARVLPPAQPAWIWYPYGESPEFPEVQTGGRTACAGPAYHFDPGLDSTLKFPAELDGTLLVFEWSRNWVQVVRFGADSEPASLEPLPGGFEFIRPVDMLFGPEGALYVLEYGTTWGTNADSRLVRIDYLRGNRRPRAVARADRSAGGAPLRVRLSSAGSADKDGDDLAYRWTLQPGGELLSTEPHPELVIAAPGSHVLELEVRDPAGARSTARLPLQVGNEPPSVEWTSPQADGFFDPSSPLSYAVRVSDAEDGDSEGDSDLAWWMENVFVEARFVAGAPPAREGGALLDADPPGLAAMKLSDCFNCHAVGQRVVGPALREIAERYGNEEAALEASLARVREGSTGVWGDAQMLPHAELEAPRLRSMLTWIFALEAEGASGLLRPGLVGEVLAAELCESDAPSGSLVLDATYTDTGGEAAGALAGTARRVLRTYRVEAEHFTWRVGTQSLDSGTAKGGTFIGAINDGDYLVFEDIDLAGIASVRSRVSSAGAGATVEFRADALDGPPIASFELEPNGAWEEWFELTAEIADPGGSHDIYVLFSNPGAPGGLMNLDSLEFRRE
jgi:cytochrome c